MNKEELKKEIATLMFEKVKIELNALAASEDFQTYSDEDEEALFDVELAIEVLEAKLEDLLEEEACHLTLKRC